MRRGREADNQHRGPDIVDILREIDRHDAAGTKEHRDLAREIGRVAGLDESRRQPAAGDAAEVGYQIDGGERQAEALEVHVVALEQIAGQPEEEEPPDRVDEEFAERVGPDLLDTEQAAPADRSEEHTSELQSLMRSPYAVFS